MGSSVGYSALQSKRWMWIQNMNINSCLKLFNSTSVLFSKSAVLTHTHREREREHALCMHSFFFIFLSHRLLLSVQLPHCQIFQPCWLHTETHTRVTQHDIRLTFYLFFFFALQEVSCSARRSAGGCTRVSGRQEGGCVRH